MSSVDITFRAELTKAQDIPGEPIAVSVTYIGPPALAPPEVLGSGTMTWVQLRNMLPGPIRALVREALDKAVADARSEADQLQVTVDAAPTEIARLEAAATEADQFTP